MSLKSHTLIKNVGGSDKPAEWTVKLVFRASNSDGAADQAFDMVEQLRTKIFSGDLPAATADGARTLKLECSP
jgi:hypothetical protein|tara:strand:- start:1423 stop:1641 length:219 start_codon:yes stop_codon:yes gene_type:complete